MKKTISIILMIILVICTTKVYAANDSFNTTLTINNSQAKRGDTIVVTIGLKDIAIKSGEKGIGAYTAEIQFDSSVLEYVSTNGTDKWEAPLYQDGLITSNTKSAEVVTTTQNIATITFKVKQNSKLGETSISLKNFSGSTAGPDVLASINGSAKLTIVDNNGSNKGSNNASNIGSNNGSSNSSSSNEKNNLKNSKKAQESSSNTAGLSVLPKTGKEQNPIVIALYVIIGLSVIGLAYLLRKERIR